jgi:hypothetical protein
VEDHHVYEPVTCPVCRLIHHVNPTTGAVLGEKAELPAAKKNSDREAGAKDNAKRQKLAAVGRAGSA